jgi:hypothetical protein
MLAVCVLYLVVKAMGCTTSTLTESVAITRTNTSAATLVSPGVPSEFDGLGLNPLLPPPNSAQDVSRLRCNNSHRDRSPHPPVIARAVSRWSNRQREAAWCPCSASAFTTHNPSGATRSTASSWSSWDRSSTTASANGTPRLPLQAHDLDCCNTEQRTNACYTILQECDTQLHSISPQLPCRVTCRLHRTTSVITASVLLASSSLIPTFLHLGERA